MATSHSSGNPPWHSVAAIGIFVAYFVKQLPQHDADYEKDDTTRIFSRALFPTILPLSVVVTLRLSVAMIIFGDLFRAFALVEYLDHKTEYYYPGSKLVAGAPIEYRGILTRQGTFWSGFLGIASFTMVCWALEGLVFFGAAVIPILEMTASSDVVSIKNLVGRIVLMGWEIVAPCAFLVSLVVTYVLWPFAMEAERRGKKGNIGLLNRLGPLLAHNLNSIAIAMELSILGGLPLRWKHFSMAPLFGCGYVIFSWAMKDYWLPPQLSDTQRKEYGPQFIYPFMDTTLGWKSTFGLLALLLVLLLSHVLVCSLQGLLQYISQNQYYNYYDRNTRQEQQQQPVDHVVESIRFGIHCSVVVAVGYLVCRFR